MTAANIAEANAITARIVPRALGEARAEQRWPRDENLWERARSEAAALRSLANTARLLEEHPGLLHLRTLQAAGHGAKLVLKTAQ